MQLLSLRVSSSSLWQESGLDSDVVFSESGARQLRHSTSPSRVVECEPGDMGNERGAHLKASCFEDLLHNVSIEAAVLDNRPVREFNSGHTYLTGRPRKVAPVGAKSQVPESRLLRTYGAVRPVYLNRN